MFNATSRREVIGTAVGDTDMHKPHTNSSWMFAVTAKLTDGHTLLRDRWQTPLLRGVVVTKNRWKNNNNKTGTATPALLSWLLEQETKKRQCAVVPKAPEQYGGHTLTRSNETSPPATWRDRLNVAYHVSRRHAAQLCTAASVSSPRVTYGLCTSSVIVRGTVGQRCNPLYYFRCWKMVINKTAREKVALNNVPVRFYFLATDPLRKSDICWPL